MSALAQVIRAVERMPFPDLITQLGIGFLVRRMKRRLVSGAFGTVDEFARDMAQRAIAEHVEVANDQHYELPPEFFALHLGPLHSDALEAHAIRLPANSVQHGESEAAPQPKPRLDRSAASPQRRFGAYPTMLLGAEQRGKHRSTVSTR